MYKLYIPTVEYYLRTAKLGYSAIQNFFFFNYRG